jgi:hypothetical protein
MLQHFYVTMQYLNATRCTAQAIIRNHKIAVNHSNSSARSTHYPLQPDVIRYFETTLSAPLKQCLTVVICEVIQT